MKIDNKNIPLFFLATLFAPIWFYMFSVHIETKQLNLNEEWLNRVRIITFIVSISYLIFLSKIENIIYNKSLQEDHTNKHNPRIISYIIGIALILSLSINTLGLQLFGLAKTIDVLIYSILSIIGILFWRWRYSNIILATMRQSVNKDKILSIISKNNHINISGKYYIRTYTTILKLLGLLFFLLLIIQFNSFFNSQNNIDANAQFKIIQLAFLFFNTVGCITAVFLRRAKSIYAI